jgi:protein disulfide-isomerase A5
MNVPLATSLKSSALAECVDRSSIVLFYAPWCGACKDYKPKFDAMAPELKEAFQGSPEPVYITKINWDKWREQSEKDGIGNNMVKGGVSTHIKEYPTIAFFHNKNMSVFNDNIEAPSKIIDAFKQFRNEMNSSEELLSMDAPHTFQAAKEVNPEEFNTYTKNGPTFAMVYAPWCGFCKRIMGVLDESAMKLREKNINVVKLDFQTHREEMVSKQIGSNIVENGGIARVIRSFPTLLMFSNGKMAQYTGPRTAESISTTMQLFHANVNP